MHVIKVSGMSCSHCVSAIEAAVLKVDARARVEVDLKAGEVRIESAEVDAPFRAAIEQAGYSVAG
ncbi:heavy-metal-associated domain-containing protein [Pseudomonas sp. No.117]